MNILIYIITIISTLISGAHFFRIDNMGLVFFSILLPLTLLIKKRWILNIYSGLLLIAFLEWILTINDIYNIRLISGKPYIRMTIILGVVSLLTLASSILIKSKRIREKYKSSKHDIAITATFFTSVILIAFPFMKMSFPIILLERFAPGYGWFQIMIMGFYGALIVEKILDPKLTSIWRRRIWLLFSIVFFTQFILGLVGFETFLMTGKLHLPIPAIILAGPVYRWALSFMVFLFLGSMILLGPAWCSYLCYFGVWDDVASRAKKKPKQLPKNRQIIRISILLIIVFSAFALNYLGASSLTATIGGLIVGIVGVIIIVIWSRKKGVMTHCTVFCPIGLLAVTLGRISPFRLKINSSCDECAKCHITCRYDALNMKDIKNRKPNINCTLCGDCVGSCPHYSIEYKFLGLNPEAARTVFVILAVVLHTSFLAIGRL